MKSTNFENLYFFAKSEAMALAFSVKSANFENPYFSAKSKAIGFAFTAKSANFESPFFGQKVRLYPWLLGKKLGYILGFFGKIGQI